MEWQAEVTLWLKRSGTGQQAQGKVNVDQEPCPTIMAGGLGGGNCSQYWLEDDRKPEVTYNIMKSPYRVPLMSEIVQIPWNGLKVASTFSGAGGSCTGYRMAGYQVIWANEFVPAAQASYKANAASDSILDPRDIRTVQASEILQATGLKAGELDLFDGSPPCQAFSTAGKREKGWGKGKIYEHGAVQKNEELFTEYIRLLRGLQPKVFVAENVSGLIKGTAKGYFLEILKELKASGYRVICKLLDAQWLGVPQMRQRTIFVGVREDLGLDPAHPEPLPYRYSVRDAVPWIESVTFDPHGQFSVRHNDGSLPNNCIPATSADATHFQITLLPPSRLKVGAYGVQDVQPDKPCPTVTCGSPGNDLAVVIEGANGFNNHAGSAVSQPMPTVQAGRPVNVVDGPSRRKFTIAELKRICSFPDDFILTGSYSQQWERLGNSVPPVMMRWIAQTIQEKIFSHLASR